MALEIKSVELPGGVTLQYVEQGDPAGLTVVLLHGYSDSWYSFAPVLPYLPGSLHVFALSQRGHGDAGRPAAGYRPQDFAADVAGLLDAHGIGSALIVGHSLGSFVSQAFALHFPFRTFGLVLVGSAPLLRTNPVWMEIGEGVRELTDPVDPAFVRAFQQGTLAQPVPTDFFDTVVQESLKMPARVWQAVWQAFNDHDFAQELGQIRVPALNIWGDQDAVFSRSEQEALVAAITGAQFLVYPGAGHALHWEEPGRFAADLAAFIKTIGK